MLKNKYCLWFWSFSWKNKAETALNFDAGMDADPACSQAYF